MGSSVTYINTSMRSCRESVSLCCRISNRMCGIYIYLLFCAILRRYCSGVMPTFSRKSLMK